MLEVPTDDDAFDNEVAAEDEGAALVPDDAAVADEETTPEPDAAEEALVAWELELDNRDAEDVPAEDDTAADEPPPDELLLLDSPVPVVQARFTTANATPSHQPPRTRTIIPAPFWV